MNNIKLKIILTLNILVGVFSTSFSQTESTLSFMDDLYQSTYYSPFNTSDFKVSIGLPGISSIYLDVIHSGFSMADIYPGVGGTFDPNDLFSGMKSVEYMGADVKTDLFHLFIQRGKNAFSFNVTENVSSRVSYPLGLLKLGWDGNGGFDEGKIDLSGFGLDFQHYREFALGYYRKMDKLQVGGKAKLLFGKSSVRTEKTDITIDVGTDIYGHDANAELQVNYGGFDYTLLSDSTLDEFELASQYLRNTKNWGLGLDLGASYQLNEKLQVNAALTDFGFIKWNSDVSNLSYKESVLFEGVDFFKIVYDAGLDSLEEGFEEYFGTVLPDTVILDSTNNSYRTGLSMNFAIGGRYKLLKGTYAVGRLNLRGYRGLRSAFTLGIYHDLFRWFNIGLTNTSMNKKVINPGLAFVLKGGPVQFYMSTDALRSIRFMQAQHLNLRFGINLVFGDMKSPEKITSVQN